MVISHLGDDEEALSAVTTLAAWKPSFSLFDLLSWVETQEPKKRVTFSTIEVREYGLVMGDHPMASIPISLDWAYNPATIIMSVTQHEIDRKKIKDKRQKKRRKVRKLNFRERLERLKEVGGFTDKEVYLAEKDRQDKLERELQELEMANWLEEQENRRNAPASLCLKRVKGKYQGLLEQALYRASGGMAPRSLATFGESKKRRQVPPLHPSRKASRGISQL
jgi:hypothetical protein